MRFTRPARRAVPESVVPMINVVFLLLIFFLMSARITPPPPVAVTLPLAAADRVAGEGLRVYLDAAGLAFRDLREEAAWQALAAQARGQTAVLRADADLPGAEVARTLSRLGALGFAKLDLAVRRQ
jgi:biopolymer transport protein ExbD